MANNVYTFTTAIQEKILYLLWIDKQSYVMYYDLIKPQYFKKAHHIDLCRIILDYWQEYGCPPTKEVLEQEVANLVSRSKSKQKIEAEYYACIERMSNMDLADYDYIKERIFEFGKKQALIEAIMECADLLENGRVTDYDKISDIIRNAQQAGEDVNDLGVDYWDNVDERIDSYSVDEDVIERFPTEMGELDVVLKGGLGRTEMGVVVAPPGRGKTTFMINCGANALRRGRCVVHISFENNEKQIVRNYDLRMLNHSLQYIVDNPEKSAQALGRIKKYGNGRLFVKKYPTKGATVNNIRMYLNRLSIVYGVTPDMLIVDYGAIMKPTQSYSDKRNTIETNYEDLRALADEFNLALWTGAQGNRLSLSKRIVTMEDLADCFAIANTADVMVCLCQTAKENKQNRIRGFITKNRDGSGNVLLSGAINYETKNIMFLEDITDEEVGDDDDDEDNSPEWKDEGRQYKRKGGQVKNE